MIILKGDLHTCVLIQIGASLQQKQQANSCLLISMCQKGQSELPAS